MLQMHIQVAMLTRQEPAHIYLHKPSGEMAENFLMARRKQEQGCHMPPFPHGPWHTLPLFMSFSVFFPKERM